MKKTSLYREFFIVTVAVTAVAGLCYPVSDWIGYRSVALILLLAVSVLAMRFSLWPVLTAASLSALIWDYFFIPPHFTLSVGSGEDGLLLVMYFAVALLNGIFNHRLRKLEEIGRQKEEKETIIRLYNTLFSSLSHDLRTPIAAIIGAADTLQEGQAQLSGKQRNELTSEILGAALRLHQQVENLLNSSRVESGFIRPRADWCEVPELVYGVLEKLEKELQDHPVDVSLPENLPLMQLDYGLTEQILLNLISNAARHTPAGSLIGLSARVVAEKRGHFTESKDQDTLTTQTDGFTHTLFLEVTDNGPGFPQGELDLVFDKFYRLKNSGAGGTGLGLFIARGFTEVQGGEISVKNRPDGGACFTVEIPVLTLSVPQSDPLLK